jgi:hypothetical protein
MGNRVPPLQLSDYKQLLLMIYLLRMMYHNKANLGKINHPGT